MIKTDLVKNSFNARGLPDVKTGKITDEEALSTFLDNFDFYYS